MTETLVVIGGGGFGRETLDVADAINLERPASFKILGVVDDMPSDRTKALLDARGVKWLGGIDRWLDGDDAAAYVIAVGNPRVRAQVAARLVTTDRRAATLIHPRATIGSVGTIGAGSVICSGVEISTNVTIGQHVHLNPSVTVGHDAVLADAVSVNPAAVLSGDVRIGPRVLIGAGAVILQGLAVGHDSTVGASACVTLDVPSGVTVKGVPAR